MFDLANGPTSAGQREFYTSKTLDKETLCYVEQTGREHHDVGGRERVAGGGDDAAAGDGHHAQYRDHRSLDADEGRNPEPRRTHCGWRSGGNPRIAELDHDRAEREGEGEHQGESRRDFRI